MKDQDEERIVTSGEYAVRQLIPAEPGWWSVCAYNVYEDKKPLFYQQTRVVAWVMYRERTVERWKETSEVYCCGKWFTGYGALCVADDAVEMDPMFLDAECAERCENATHLGYRREERPWKEWLAEAVKCWPELEESDEEAAEQPHEREVS